MNDFPKNINGCKTNLLLKFAEKLYRDLATVTEALLICCLRYVP
jgi:hypothetical protein